MKLFLSILISVIGAVTLYIFSPLLATAILLGIIIGCLARGLYLLTAIYKQIVPQEDKVSAAVREHLEQRVK